MKKFTKQDVMQKVHDAFCEATENVMNGETPVDMELMNTGSDVTVYFNVDCGRGGIDSYNGSEVSFSDGSVQCVAGDSLEGCGVDGEVEEILKDFAKELNEGEIVAKTRTLVMKNQDMIDTVESILEDFNIKVEDGEENGQITLTYEIPIKIK